jgi:hypothetical protein
MKINDIVGVKLKEETIASATDSRGNVSRAKADKIADPRGYFAKNKRSLPKKGRYKFAAN